jgi:hypothetical protein
METEKTLNERIMAITQLLNEKYPELMQFVPEMTQTNPDEKDPDINRKTLKEYYDSLIQMIKKYKPDYKFSAIAGHEK